MENLGKQAFTGAAKFILALFVLIFLPAWTLHYWQGWLYLAVFGTATLLQTAYPAAACQQGYREYMGKTRYRLLPWVW